MLTLKSRISVLKGKGIRNFIFPDVLPFFVFLPEMYVLFSHRRINSICGHNQKFCPLLPILLPPELSKGDKNGPWSLVTG